MIPAGGPFMQPAPALHETANRFDEPVRSLLRTKGRNQVWSIGPEETVFRAIELMSEKQIGCLVVLIGGQLAGIVSERDYARTVSLQGRSSQQTRVSEIMSTPALFVTPEKTVAESMRIMTNRRVRHLPVLEGDNVVGMLSIGDLVNWVITSQQQTIRHLHNYIAGNYPA
jgi:signal-transduction protein with cAMP-binding, CBS, and nucleotidyltransferase domain